MIKDYLSHQIKPLMLARWDVVERQCKACFVEEVGEQLLFRVRKYQSDYAVMVK